MIWILHKLNTTQTHGQTWILDLTQHWNLQFPFQGWKWQTWSLQKRCHLFLLSQIHWRTSNSRHFDCQEKTVSLWCACDSRWRNSSFCHWVSTHLLEGHWEQRGRRNSSYSGIYQSWTGHSGNLMEIWPTWKFYIQILDLCSLFVINWYNWLW